MAKKSKMVKFPIRLGKFCWCGVMDCTALDYIGELFKNVNGVVLKIGCQRHPIAYWQAAIRPGARSELAEAIKLEFRSSLNKAKPAMRALLAKARKLARSL